MRAIEESTILTALRVMGCEDTLSNRWVIKTIYGIGRNDGALDLLDGR